MRINIRNLQFGRKTLLVGILIISIIWGANAGCNLLMCTKSDDTVAVAAAKDPEELKKAQTFIVTQCPGVTSVTNCEVDCNGPYHPGATQAYFIWRNCQDNFADSFNDYICPHNVLKICKLGYDPDYPFN
ncbi:9315_t:CDS:1 [Funneliformis mosseae]|uniref:9315_t:CDS:1 n=1 Tax=Funneliformis mosseae TaxID=27381 RepID=A0A9N9AP28_FUNMO|nr:9315_t:CDS:1 [Funneliformis mosseae]